MKLPNEIRAVLEKLADAGFEGYAVGGCVRDLILGNKPKDWDITTNAGPEKIQEIFPDSFYENSFGTVTIRTPSEKDNLREIQITPYRTESKYSDRRRPDEIMFVKTLNEDLSRRDFTINAMALDLHGNLIDIFEGQKDIKEKLIRTVGNPEDRFNEDALRILRAIRFATVLDFKIEKTTSEKILQNSQWLKDISQERIRDELTKIIMSENAYEGVELLRDTGTLKYVISELLEGIGVEQNHHHIYTVWEHNLRALKYSAEKNYSLEVRLASLLHDVGKPRSKRGEAKNSTFHGHEIIGGRMAATIMDRLKFPKSISDKVIKLVRYHLFYYNVGEVTESSVRRLLANVGKENMEDLLKIREADRIGSGTPKAIPYKLRHLKFMLDKVSRDPISPKMLKLNGEDVMRIALIKPGPLVGMIVDALMGEVLDNPANNNNEYLEKRIVELAQMSQKELERIAQGGKKVTEEKENLEISKIKRKHSV